MRILKSLGMISFLFALAIQVQGQNFIGMHKNDIMQVMKDSRKNFKLNTGVVNPHYKYLKYEDKINEMTLLFFLSEEDICTMSRQMCDYSNINDMENYLNSTYIPDGKNKWFYTVDGIQYSVQLVEEDWFFTVTTQLKQE